MILKKAFLYPTLACNLNCIMCYSRPEDPGKKKELTLEQYRELVGRLYKAGVRHFDISGGEPFLYRDLEDLVEEIKGYPNTRIDLVSNGTLIASRYEKDIRRILEKVDQVFLSLDSMDADKHDFIRRGTGAFEKTMAAIRLVQRDFQGKIGINCVVSEENRDQVEPLLKFAVQEKIAYISFLRYIDVSSSKQNLNLYTQENIELYQKVLSFVKNQGEGGFLPEIEIGMPGYMAPLLKKQIVRHPAVSVYYDPIRGCHAFEGNFAVTADGMVTGCTAMVKYPQLSCGDVTADSMEKIQSGLQQKKELLREREALLKTKEPCKSCEYFSYCRGGCPAAAMQRYGTIMMPDPSCVKRSGNE